MAANRPLALIAAGDDELMLSDQYQAAVGPSVPVRVIPGVNHMAVLSAPDAVAAIAGDVANYRRPGDGWVMMMDSKGARHTAHWLVNQAGRDSYDMTTPRLAHHLYRALGHMKEAGDIGGDVGRVVVVRIGDERLGDERAGVVDQRVDAAEAAQRLLEDPIRGVRVSDISLHRHQVLIATWFYRSRSGNDAIVAAPESLNERCANSP